MFVRLTAFSLPDNKKSEVIAAYYAAIAPVIKQQPGLVQVLLLEPVAAGGDFLSCTTWETEAALRAFETGDDYPAIFGIIKSATTAPPTQQYYMVKD